MADTTETNNNNSNINNNNNEIKPKIQIRSNGSINGLDKSPSPATKLLINHGKPNFTIQRSPKIQENGNSGSLTAENIKNNNYNAYKTANSVHNTNNTIVVGTKFNGVFKPSNVTVNSAKSLASTENEAAKVVLRRARQPEPPVQKEAEDENVPEFILRQRRIQERLAKENVLDFENRRSGYFTHVMISPDSPNRTSFVETMASPAIVPSLEMPTSVAQPQRIVEEEQHELQNGEEKKAEEQEEKQCENSASQEEQTLETQAESVLSNGHGDDADIAQAIEEVNKAVAGEEEAEVVEPEVTTSVPVTMTSAPLVEDTEDTTADNSETGIAATVEAKVEVHTPLVAVSVDHHEQNGEVTTNGHAQEDDGITISHTNGTSIGPSIPSPDTSGALGVNYEPKTVVSFAQELGNGENKYPDTVKIVKDGELVDKPAENGDDNLQDLAKLKFEITGDQADVQVTHVLKTE